VLFDGTRVSKADPRVDAYGDIDELASWLGVVSARLDGSDLLDMVAHVQRDLMALASRLADPRHKIASRVDKVSLTDKDVTRLEGWIDALEAELPPLRRFILAGGSDAGSGFHFARAICRRSERRIVALGPGAVDGVVLVYINRLSDLLFTMARAANARAGVADVEW
jgi:cob(I)alamin adenosyltransferase